MSYSVIVKGFKSKEEAQVFVDWYEGEGEQASEYWLSIARSGKEDLIRDSLYVDLKKRYEYTEDSITFYIDDMSPDDYIETISEATERVLAERELSELDMPGGFNE